jgi:hypothetical protein
VYAPGDCGEEPGSTTPSQVYDDRPAKGRGTYDFDEASLGADSLPAGASPPRQRDRKYSDIPSSLHYPGPSGRSPFSPELTLNLNLTLTLARTLKPDQTIVHTSVHDASGSVQTSALAKALGSICTAKPCHSAAVSNLLCSQVD